jgi:putative transposase
MTTRNKPSPLMWRVIHSTWVIEVLSRLISMHGAPRYLRSDSGSEFVSVALHK